MSSVQIVVAVAAGVILFLFGIEQFSKEVQAISGQRFRRFLARGTQNRFLGFLLGGVITAVIQSSTATSVITVGLVNAGVLSFRQSLSILFGANVGTTVTAQLVALRLTDFAPALILLGFVAGYLPFRWRILSRATFYFGLVFFSLSMLSAAAAPLRDDPRVLELFASVREPSLLLLLGAVFTGVVQSSSVTTGIAIVLLQQGVIDLYAALPLVLGANIGTTVTALLAATSLDTSARRTAVSHALYNASGVLLFLPVLGPLERVLLHVADAPASRLAVAHLLFNSTLAVLFLVFLGPFGRAVERLVRDSETEEPLPPAPPIDPSRPDEALDQSERWVRGIISRLLGCYTAAALCLQTRDSKIRSRAQRLVSIVHFGLEEAEELVQKLAAQTLTEEQSTAILRLIVTVDHIHQVMDSIEDLMGVDQSLNRRAARFSIDDLLDLQKIYPLTAKMLETMVLTAEEPTRQHDEQLETLEGQLGKALGGCYLRFIERVRGEHEGSEFAAVLSIHQRMRSKATAFGAHLIEAREA